MKIVTVTKDVFLEVWKWCNPKEQQPFWLPTPHIFLPEENAIIVLAIEVEAASLEHLRPITRIEMASQIARTNFKRIPGVE
jgi:hypothetical protein